MADTVETKPTETVKESVIETKVEKVEPVKEPTIDEIKEENERLKQHAANKEQEAERHFKKLQSFEKAEQDKKDAELTELQKEQKRAAVLEAENKKIKLDLLKQSTASKLGLPEILANRLQGETPDEIEQDAKQLLEKLPKKANPASATNPGGDHQVTETDAERRRRLGI
jgi:hypothetical protein